METQCSDWLLADPPVNWNSAAGKGEIIFSLKSVPHARCKPTSLMSASHHLHTPSANLSCFQKRTFIAVRGSNPGVARFSARPNRSWGSHSLLDNGYWVFPGGKVRPGRAADH